MPTKRITIGNRSLAFDARPDRLDIRDRLYTGRLGNLPQRFPDDETLAEYLPAYGELILDQGEEGACTGFGLAAVINYLLFVQRQRDGAGESKTVSPAMLYQLAKLYDEWPGEDYEGSSCRGALKGWHRHGVCREDLWKHVIPAAGKKKSKAARPKENDADRDDAETNWDVDALDCTLGVYFRIDARSVVDMQSAIRDTGAIYVSATVHEGWGVDTKTEISCHADLVDITHVARPKEPGGHAFALVGYNERGFVVQNSWGRGWGSNGFALLPYESWVAHGDDAWVFTLGVSRLEALLGSRKSVRGGAARRITRTSRFLVPSMDPGSESLIERPVGLVGASDTLERRFERGGSEAKALDPWSTDDAYAHALVMDRGYPLSNDITARNVDEALHDTVVGRPTLWARRNGVERIKFLIYAHGGLNSESDSIQRIRAMGPYCAAAGLYPLFLTWRSGAMETVSDIVEETFARLGFGSPASLPARGFLDRLVEKTDRLLEPILRPAGAALWTQMKTNAVRASAERSGACKRLVTLLEKLGEEFEYELHFVGHSAGSIILGAMFDLLRKAEIPVSTLRLFAPACTTRFALDHYKTAVEDGILERENFYIHVLSDKNELDDKVGPYRKSLLYLVSRAFEEEHKTPILGLERSFDGGGDDDDIWSDDGKSDVEKWATFWSEHPDPRKQHLRVLSDAKVSNGVREIDSSHGCFDNAVDILTETINRAAGLEGNRRIRIGRLDY